MIDVSPNDIFSIGALRALLKATCANAGGMRAWGRLHGITAAYISRVVRGEKMPGPKLLDALNLTPSTVYVFKHRKRGGPQVKASADVCKCAKPEPALTEHGMNALCEKCYRPVHADVPHVMPTIDKQAQ